MWSGQPKEGSLQTPKTSHGNETVQDLTKAWDTLSQTKTTLRHIENKLEAAPTSTVVCDSVVSSKKPSASATRKVSRKDGRYLEDSSVPAATVKASSRGKTRKEKASRSPLRVTTFESNVKKASRVEFRDPLASYRETYSASSYMTSSQLEAKALLAGVESVKAEAPVHTVYSRDTQDFDSTRSSAIDDTVVRYLNDRPAIDALQTTEPLFRGGSPSRAEEVRASAGSREPETAWTDNPLSAQETELRSFCVAETPQSSVSSTGSHRLEILRRRQHDAKLEKLKERIRKQWEHTGEAGDIRNPRHGHSEQPILVNNTESTVTTAKVRKVAMAPPAPAYKGFNPTETKIRTPDGKVWPEAEFHNISRELYRDLALKDGATTTDKATEKGREKKTSRPVRKVQKVARTLSPDVKSGGCHVISTTSWRDGQKLVKKILGPPPKLERGGRAESSDRSSREKATRSGSTRRAESGSRSEVYGKGRSRSSERPWSKEHSERNMIKSEPNLAAEKPEKEDKEPVNKDFLPLEIRGILDDLQLDSKHRAAKQEVAVPSHKSGRSNSPTKRKPDKATAGDEHPVTSKKRHYDSEEMRQYILRQQEERKKKQNEEKNAQKEAREQKTKRLQELYKKQKEAFAKSKSMSVPEPSAATRLQETYSKLMLEQTWLKEPASQPRPGYQPSGESDKENKGQERPLSASSSSDLSLSEPPQPLARSDLMDPTWMQPDRLSPRSSLPHPQAPRIPLYPPQSERVPVTSPHGPAASEGGSLFSHLLTLEQMGFLQKDGESGLSTKKQIPSTSRGPSNLPLQTYIASVDSQQDPSAKPGTSQYQRKLDRIEALKATAASLSNRVESEARQLACGSINYSTVWNTKLDLLRPSQDDDRWAKPVSPPVRERGEDAFSTRIQKMLDTCVSHATFDTDLPGVGNLHEFRKLPQTIRPHSAVASLGIRSFGVSRAEEMPIQQNQKPMDPELMNKEYPVASPEHQVGVSHDSSTGSISEGPLLSEGSLSESERNPHDRSPLNVTEALNGMEFCVSAESQIYGPMKEFQKDVENYRPLHGQTWNSTQGQRPWEELAKGSPHSVINIYAKSYLYGKGVEERSEASSPVLQPLLPSLQESVSYEDDFASSQGSMTLTDGQLAPEPSGGSSNSSVHEELTSRNTPSQHSPSGRSGATSRSSASSKRRVKGERLKSHSTAHHFSTNHDRTPPRGDGLSQQDRKSLKNRTTSPARDNDLNQETDSTLEDLSAHSFASISPDSGRSQRTPTAPLSPGSTNADPPENVAGHFSTPGALPSAAAVPPSLNTSIAFPDPNILTSIAGTTVATGQMRFSPAALQHRMVAELNYLSTIEESVRQLSDVERVRGISLAQQETVSLAQILKAQQQRHVQDMAHLKLKAEQEAHDSQRQLDESRQKAAQDHADTLQQLVQSRKDTAEQLQMTTAKIAEQQIEAARLNTDAARQIREMTELAHNRMSEVVVPAAPITTLFDRERQQHSEFMKQLRARVDTHRTEMKSQAHSAETGVPTSVAADSAGSRPHYSPSYDSYSESSRSKNHDQSSTSSSRQESPSVPSSKEKDMKVPPRDKLDGSIEEAALTAEDDSLHSESVPSLPEERDSTFVASEYSLKFDESMTEDEIEEKSFRSLLPSESHRRFNLEKRRGIRDDSDEEASPQKAALASMKELSLPFSEGQDSFSRFTMEMVRQYMKEEEMRAAHQSSLLRLRQRALKEKTKAELAWLEHQKKRLRDKGEDDKMPPIRKRQRGLLLRLQLEQAEIKRLQDASKAARKERQLILKQQEEIERIRQTTMKLQEKLKSAGEGKQDLTSESEMKLSDPSSPVRTDRQSRSPSPVSISGSETSSIMQKLKKMRSRMDEKFLTKREQKLMQRRQHAQELLEWKRRLDAEEAEVRRIEKQALVAWDRERPKPSTSWRETDVPRTEGKGSEVGSPVPSSQLHSESSVPEELPSLPVESKSHEPVENHEDSAVAEDLASSQESKPPTSSSKPSPTKSRSSSTNLKIVSSKESTKGPPGTRPQQLSRSWSEDSLSMTQSETTSDQSDIESRIRALKDELKKRKSVVDQLKKEQKKRQKERLKAQEASLIKQLESYDEFIKRTEAELNRDLEGTPSAKPQIKTPSSTNEKLKFKAPPLHRPEAVKSWKSLSDSDRSRGSLESITEHITSLSPENIQSSILKRVSDAEESSRTPSPNLKSPLRSKADAVDAVDSLPTSPVPADRAKAASRSEEVSGDESVVSSQRSDIPEEVIESEVEDTDNLLSLKLDSALRLDLRIGKSSESASKEDRLIQQHPPLNDHIDLETERFPGGQEILQTLGQEEAFRDQNSFSECTPRSISKSAKEHEVPTSGQVSFRREPSYSEDFDVSSPRKLPSLEGTPRAETYRDDFESSSALSARKDLHSEGPIVTEKEKSQHTKVPRSISTSLGSDEDISEHFSKSLSVSVSIHSEELLVLKPSAEILRDEKHDIEGEVDATKLLPPSPPLEADSLHGFTLGDRVLVSNVQPGTLRFKGKTHFAEGFWAGVELDKSEGNNDGTYDGTTYFDCKEKHGIFAPPHKISHFPADFEVSSEANDDNSYPDEDPNMQLEQDWEGQVEPPPIQEEDDQRALVKSPVEPPAEMTVLASSVVKSTDPESSSKANHMKEVLTDVELCHDRSPAVSTDHSEIHIAEEYLSVQTLDETDGRPSILETQRKGPPTEVLSRGVIETSATPLLYLLTKEKDHLEAQLLIPSSEEIITEVGTQNERVSLLTESLLQTFVKDTVSQLQQIRKVRHEKINLSNRDLHREVVPQREESMPRVPLWQLQVPEDTTVGLQNLFLGSDLEDDREEVSSPDQFLRPESPVFGANGQEELTKRLSELELRREFLSEIGDDQDWFDEDFGLGSRKVLSKQSEAPLPKVEPAVVKAQEEPLLAVPHTVAEVERLVHTATEELWKWKQQGRDLQSIIIPSDFMDNSTKGEGLECVSRRVYKEAVFDLTREIFGEIFAEDPTLLQPVWMKPYRATSVYYRRVKNPNDLEEIKTFLTAEVLKLTSLRKEPNLKTDWQKMMKFGRKKRDRVDHILVQELHEEEAQWVNYDEDELCVKMQLADGIFEALIRDTVNVLHKIQEKQIRMLLV